MHFMKMRLYFEDEAPRIGSGWRTVYVVSLGYKWARLRCAASERGAKIKRELFDRIILKGENCPR